MPTFVKQGTIEVEVEEQIAAVVFSSKFHDLAGILREAANFISQKGWDVYSIHYDKGSMTEPTVVTFMVLAEKEVIYPTVSLTLNRLNLDDDDL